MGADIYDWERVHGKGSYQELVDGGCSLERGIHQDGCSHGRTGGARIPEKPHAPGPRRMVGRQATRRDCLSCGQPWPCEGSWQSRAETAEAKVAALRTVLLEGGQLDSTARRRALAIIVAEEPSP